MAERHRRAAVLAVLVLVAASSIGCIETVYPFDSPPGPDAHDVTDPDQGPRIAFTVPEGDLAGRYVFGDDMLCEYDEATGGTYVVRGAHDYWESAPAQDGLALLVFFVEPQDWDYLTDGWDMYWQKGLDQVGLDPGPLCSVQVVNGWPELTATFECHNATVDMGDGGEIEMLDGVIECP